MIRPSFMQTVSIGKLLLVAGFVLVLGVLLGLRAAHFGAPEHEEFKAWKRTEAERTERGWRVWGVFLVQEVDGEAAGTAFLAAPGYSSDDTPLAINAASRWVETHGVPGSMVLAEESNDKEYRFTWLAGGLGGDLGGAPPGLGPQEETR